MSASPSEQQLSLKIRRREALGAAFIRAIGYISAVAIFGAIGFLIYWRVNMAPKLEVDYIKKVYGADRKGVPKPTGDDSDPRKRLDVSDLHSAPAWSGNGGTTASNRVANVEVVDMSVHPKGETARGAEASSEIENLESKKADIGQAVKDFFTAKTLTEMLPLVRDARRVRPLMEEYYARLPIERHVWKSLGTLTPVKEPGYRFVFVEAIFEDGPPAYVVVEESDVGFLVDWESAICYSEARLRDFLDKRIERPTLFRVLASRAQPGEGPPANAADARIILKLSHPREDGIVYGAFDSNDPQMHPLLDQLTNCNWKDAPITVRLSFAAGSPGDSVQITSVEGRGWLILNHPKTVGGG